MLHQICRAEVKYLRLEKVLLPAGADPEIVRITSRAYCWTREWRKDNVKPGLEEILPISEEESAVSSWWNNGAPKILRVIGRFQDRMEHAEGISHLEEELLEYTTAEDVLHQTLQACKSSPADEVKDVPREHLRAIAASTGGTDLNKALNEHPETWYFKYVPNTQKLTYSNEDPAWWIQLNAADAGTLQSWAPENHDRQWIVAFAKENWKHDFEGWQRL
ncbi:uncharacterized protein JN550_013788, partial [Neoarthrinium moseri]|uniref:uncharacterized protein n=1 Tax=Neoarthrinium moseri TaxID=1658444 RepID=UPI001FDCEDA6